MTLRSNQRISFLELLKTFLSKRKLYQRNKYIENRTDELDASKTLIVHCQSDDKSRTASGTLAQHGFIVYNMPGGINAWKEKNRYFDCNANACTDTNSFSHSNTFANNIAYTHANTRREEADSRHRLRY